MNSTIFRHFDRAALDREYDNVKKVSPELFRQVLDFCEIASAAALEKHDGVLDIAYGKTSLERLDIFRAGKACMPVHVFFHGGYWRALDKRDFSYIADALVPHGVTTVVVNYPLLPGVTMDVLISACRRALRWISENIEAYGGDPTQLSISGHSSGAHIAAMMLSQSCSAAHGSFELPRLTHACLISGIYDLNPIRCSFLNDDLRLTEADVDRNSPVLLARRSACPIAVVVGGEEGDEYLRQSRELHQAWARPQHPAFMKILDNENHFSLRTQLGDADSPLIRLMLETKL